MVWRGREYIQAAQSSESTGYPILDNQLEGIGWLEESLHIARQCTFEPGSLRYEYPSDLVVEVAMVAAGVTFVTQEDETGNESRY